MGVRDRRGRPYYGQVHNLHCPECGSSRLTQDGSQISHRRRKKRYLCNNCWRRTIYPNTRK